MSKNPESMEKEIKIVSPEEKDMLGIEQLLYKTWLETYPNEKLGITREDIEDRFKGKFTEEAMKKRWEKVQKDSQTNRLIAKDGEIVVGFISITSHPDSNQLQAIYVLPEYQNRGVGKKLWNETQKYFDHAKKSLVQVATYNTNAINFYEKLGFKDNGKRWEDEKAKMKSGSNIPQIELEMEVM